MRVITVIFILLFTSVLTTAAPHLNRGAERKIYYSIPTLQHGKFLKSLTEAESMITLAHLRLEQPRITETPAFTKMLGVANSIALSNYEPLLSLFGTFDSLKSIDDGNQFQPSMGVLFTTVIPANVDCSNNRYAHVAGIDRKRIYLCPKAFSGTNADDVSFRRLKNTLQFRDGVPLPVIMLIALQMTLPRKMIDYTGTCGSTDWSIERIAGLNDERKKYSAVNYAYFALLAQYAQVGGNRNTDWFKPQGSLPALGLTVPELSPGSGLPSPNSPLGPFTPTTPSGQPVVHIVTPNRDSSL